jgi:hypothetical protein
VTTSDRIPEVTKNLSQEPRINGKVLTSDVARDSDVGIGYLDMVMEKLTGGINMDAALYERARVSFNHNMDATWNLGEIADDFRDMEGSVDAPTADMIISRVWSKHHPELAQELKQFIMSSHHSHIGGNGIPQTKASNFETNTTGSYNVPRTCSCDGKDSDNMIACYNATCPNGWFHLSCVSRVITPLQNERWFCNDACGEADEARENDDDETSDSDDS